MRKTKKNEIHIKPKNRSNTKLQWRSFDQVFKKTSRNESFRRAYNEELLRLRLAKQIRQLRMSQQLTQRTLAQRAGMPQSVIARLESGEKGISLDTLGKIAHAFGKRVHLD